MKNERKKSALPQFSPLSIARMVWKKRFLICATWLLITIAALFVVRRLPNVYEAEAMVLVDSQKIPEKYVTSTVQVSLQDSLNAINQRVLAGAKLLQIIHDFHLYEDQWESKSPEELMDRLRSKDLTFTLDRGMGGTRASAFRVSFAGRSPKEVAGVVNRITDLFIHENATVRERRAEGTADFIESQLQEAKRRLDEEEAAVTRFKIQYTGELPEQATTLLSALTGLRTQLQGNQDSLNRVQQTITILENTARFAESSLQAATRAVSPVQSPSKDGVETASVVRQVLPSDTLREKLAALRARYTDDHPDVKRLKEELDRALALEAGAASQAAARAENSAGSPRDASPPLPPPAPGAAEVSPQALAEINQLRERVFNTRTQLDAARREMATLNTERVDIVQQIANYEDRIEKLPVREQQLAILMRDYDISKASYQQLLDRKFSAGMATAMEKSDESERFVVADPAREPSKPVRPNRPMYLAGGSMAGFAFGLVLGLAIELKKNTFLGEWELPPGVPVFGRIPEIPRVPVPVRILPGLGLALLVISWGYSMSSRLTGFPG